MMLSFRFVLFVFTFVFVLTVLLVRSRDPGAPDDKADRNAEMSRRGALDRNRMPPC